jgi:hypothetical protein
MPIASARFGLMTPLLLGGDGRGRFGAQRRRGMQRAWPAEGAGAARSRRAATHARAAHHGLAGTNGAAIDGLSGNGRGTACGHTRPGSLLYLPRSRTSLLLLQSRNHIGARRNYRTRGRLSGQVRAWLWPQGRARRWAGQRSGRFARGSRRSSTCHRLGWKHHRRRRHGWRGAGRRHRLSRPRQNLARAWRGNRTSRNRTRAQRGMQRSGAASGQWRPQRGGFAAKRFFY